MNRKYRARRQFLKSAAHTALLGSSAFAVNGKMSLIGSALAAGDNVRDLTGYKALVCVYLYGGSDSFSMFAPGDENFDKFIEGRVEDFLSEGREFLPSTTSPMVRFHPNLSNLRNFYNSGSLAIMRNVGNLYTEIGSRAAYINDPSIAPVDLFAHDHQEEQVLKSYSSRPVGLTGAGWGGRMADLLQEANNGADLPPTFSMNNANFFLPGNFSAPIAIDAESGPQLMSFYDERRLNGGIRGANVARSNAMEQILAMSQPSNLLEQFAQRSMTTARESGRALASVVAGSPDLGPVNSSNSLDLQLNMVARMISGQQQLGLQRQVFFVGMGGWDTHDNQEVELNSLTARLDEAFGNYSTALDQLGMQDQVTTFTLSDFGRTVTRNGDGTDHGWGGHYMVMGGAVNGGQLYGDWPDFTVGGGSDVGDKGRIIPTMSLNQYGAALGKWMGLSDNDLYTVFPDLENFNDTAWRQSYGLFS